MSKDTFDFYTDINNKWIKESSIPDDLVSFSIFDILEKNIKSNIIDHIKKERTNDTPLGTFIDSIYNRRDSASEIEDFVKTLQFKTKEELFKVLGVLNLYGLYSPIEFNISNDSRNTDRYAIIIDEPSLQLIKEEYVKGSQIYKKYGEFLNKLANLIGLSPSLVNDFINMEYRLSRFYYDQSDKQNIDKIYNPKTYKQITDEYPLLKCFFDTLEVPLNNINIVVSNPLLLSEIYTVLQQYSIEKWNGFIKLYTYLSVITLLPEPFESISFNFKEKFMIGRKKPKTEDYKTFDICNEFCSETIGKLYIESNIIKFNRTKEEAASLLKTVMRSAKKAVLKINWLSESSRKIAIFKLEKMKSRIAFPTHWVKEFDGFSKKMGKSFIKNMLLLNKTTVSNNLDKLTKTTKEMTWDNPCYEVNAYYYTELNLLCIPIGFLSAPFFSLEQSFVKNLAGLGNIMAHEMAHGFDEEGRKFDENGNYKPWWISTDIDMYNKKTQQLINFFSKETYFGLSVNGKLTLGENLADLGAMSICLEVLKERHSNIDPNTRLAELREFFTWYAKSWIYKETTKKREQAIKKDPHSPPQVRVNAIVRHYNEFYECFNIKAGDPGFLSENERIDIWG